MDEPRNCPIWFNGKDILEAVFCEEFMSTHKLAYENNAFFTTNGRMTDELPLRREIYRRLKICAVKNIPHTISNIVDLLKFYSNDAALIPQSDRIHLANGTLFLDGTFTEGKPDIVRSRPHPVFSVGNDGNHRLPKRIESTGFPTRIIYGHSPFLAHP